MLTQISIRYSIALILFLSIIFDYYKEYFYKVFNTTLFKILNLVFDIAKLTLILFVIFLLIKYKITPNLK